MASGGEEYVFGVSVVKRESLEAFLDALEAAVHAATAASGASETAATSAADEIAKFVALRDQGVITAAEFEAKNAQLLGL